MTMSSLKRDKRLESKKRKAAAFLQLVKEEVSQTKANGNPPPPPFYLISTVSDDADTERIYVYMSCFCTDEQEARQYGFRDHIIQNSM